MADKLSAQLNATPGCIPAKWSRSTIADGDWLQAKTLNQYSSRDNWLAEKIEELSGKSNEDLEEEIQARIAGDTYLSGAIVSISSDFYPFSANVEASAAELNTKIDNEITRAKNKEGELNAKISNTNTRIDNLEAATDVIAVFGTYEEFTAASASTWQQTVTDNDYIKVIRDDNYQPNQNDPDYQTTDDDVYQVYYEYHKTNHDGWIGWSAIGSLDPYYSVSEIDDKETALSSTIANNYLSASTDAVKQGHNIKVTKQTGPVIEIATKDNVDFTELSADTAWIDTISADVSAFDFYETTSGKRLSETQQGLLINTTISPFNPTVSASEGDVFWPANFEQIFSAWYDTDKLINIKYTNNFNNITRLYTLHNVKQYTDNNVTFYDLNFISNDDKVAYTAYAKVKRNGGEGGGAPSAPVLYACDEGPIDVEYTGENGVYVSGDHKIGLSSTYETALKEGSAASAWINDNESKIAYTADFKGTNGVVTGYGTSAFAGGISSISAKTGDSTALFTGYNVSLQAGEGVGFNYGTNLLTISADGKTYAGGNYIQISGNNNSINVTTPLVNSAGSGYSAYDWITTKSATLSAGPGIQFNSAAEKTMGIYITAAGVGGVITAIAGSALSAGANYTPGRCITIDNQNKINLSSDINLNSKLVIDHYNESDSETYATANLESFKLDFSGSRDNGGVFTGQSATYNIHQLMIDNYGNDNNLSFVKLDNEKLQLSSTYKNGGFTVTSYTNLATEYFETQKAGISSPYYMKFDGYRISAGANTSTVAAAQWHDIILKANGTWVSATSQEIVIDAPYQTKIVVTASVPNSFNANTYYII